MEAVTKDKEANLWNVNINFARTSGRRFSRRYVVDCVLWAFTLRAEKRRNIFPLVRVEGILPTRRGS